MEVWNRWADRWETPAELLENDAELVSWEIDSILTQLIY
jgi:hypothetical protein